MSHKSVHDRLPGPSAILAACLANGLTGCTPGRTTEPAGQADRPSVAGCIQSGRIEVERAFGEPMPRPFDVHICGHRADMEAVAREAWQVPELPCWAVAMGSGSRLVVLDPAVWGTEACEHDPRDRVAVQRIITHELVHVFHGQHRADSEFTQADEVGWFVEGLAVEVSGQLDAERLQQAAELVRRGEGPTRLVDGWSGPARYAVAGSMVRFVRIRLGDGVEGRQGIKGLLGASTNAEILAALECDEADFLTAWRTWLSQAPQDESLSARP